MKNISYRIDDLELRKTSTVSRTPRDYLEIVKWSSISKDDSEESCYTIASWTVDKDGFVSLHFCLDRYRSVDWNNFKILIDTGYDFYKKLH